MRIAITGGPGGGKSTLVRLLHSQSTHPFVVIPEAATLLFMGGFPRHSSPEVARSTQRAIFHVQRNLEQVHDHLYPNHTHLCDRGTIDGAAYWPGTEADFFTALETSLENELNRYSAVMFMESASQGGISIKGGNNPIRNESVPEAVTLDQRLRNLWAQHPFFIHISHEQSFDKKIGNALAAFQKILPRT